MHKTLIIKLETHNKCLISLCLGRQVKWRARVCTKRKEIPQKIRAKCSVSPPNHRIQSQMACSLRGRKDAMQLHAALWLSSQGVRVQMQRGSTKINSSWIVIVTLRRGPFKATILSIEEWKIPHKMFFIDHARGIALGAMLSVPTSFRGFQSHRRLSFVLRSRKKSCRAI